MNDQSQMMNQHQMMNPQPLPPPTQAQINQMVNQAQMVANQSKMMVSQTYGQWSQQPPHSMAMPPPPPPPQMTFANPMNQMYGIAKPGRSSGGNWKGKKIMDKRKDRRNDNSSGGAGGGVGGVVGLGSVGPGGGVSYQPPTLYELEQQNRLKARRFYHPKKKFNRMGPYAHAPRNTTSYIIRAKKSGGIASLVSPCPVTPAVLPTPVFSPSREALVDMAKEEWGVDGYGSMKGLIRLRSPGHDEAVDDYDEEDDGGSSESDVEEHVEVERRLDHDLSRFEMIYPNSGVDYHNVLENRVDDQDTHIAQLEEENLILKERLYLMERELGELRRRLLCLERQHQVVEDINEEVVENVSENDSEGLRNIPLLLNKHNEEVDFVPGNRIGDCEVRREYNGETLHKELKELAVKEDFDEVIGSHGIDVGLGQNKRDDGLVNDVAEDRFSLDNQDENHDKGLHMELGKEPSRHHESGDDKIGSVSVGRAVDNVDVAGNQQSVEDTFMRESLFNEINGNDRSEKEEKERSRLSEKQDEVVVGGGEAEGSNYLVKNDATEDICMGDASRIDNEVKDGQTNE